MVSYTKFVEIMIYPWSDYVIYVVIKFQFHKIQAHLDCNISKIYILLINSNALSILVICKRTFPKEKTSIIDMLCYLIYVKKYEYIW